MKGPPGAAPAVKRPAVVMVPPPETVQVIAGCTVNAAANWSEAVAVSCRLAPAETFAIAGAT